MKLEFKKDGAYESVKEIIESNLGGSNLNQEVNDILLELPVSKINDAFVVLLEHISDLQHYKDSTTGLLVTDNKKDFWTL